MKKKIFQHFYFASVIRNQKKWWNSRKLKNRFFGTFPVFPAGKSIFSKVRLVTCWELPFGIILEKNHEKALSITQHHRDSIWVKNWRNIMKKCQKIRKRRFPTYVLNFRTEKIFSNFGLHHIWGLLMCIFVQKKSFFRRISGIFGCERFFFRRSGYVIFRALPFCIFVKKTKQKELMNRPEKTGKRWTTRQTGRQTEG